MRILSDSDNALIIGFKAELKDIYGRLRHGNPRWAELDRLFTNATPQLTRCDSVEAARTAFYAIRDEMGRVAQIGLDEQAFELGKLRAAVDRRKLDEHRTAHVAAWREKTTGRIVNRLEAITTAIEDEARDLSGRVANEADIREHLGRVADAMRASLKSIEVDVRESVLREADSNRHVA